MPELHLMGAFMRATSSGPRWTGVSLPVPFLRQPPRRGRHAIRNRILDGAIRLQQRLGMNAGIPRRLLLIKSWMSCGDSSPTCRAMAVAWTAHGSIDSIGVNTNIGKPNRACRPVAQPGLLQGARRRPSSRRKREGKLAVA
ncbi:hypothetical protein [Roseateles sp.]|uniref:hypothetical protein n=1 Tax=Roseateles sp. TaxID=1971397 RepID=UPI0039ED6CCD